MAETNGTATTWGQTFTLADLQRLERELAAMPTPPWTLISPDGRAWQSADPQDLFRVLAGAVMASWPAGVGGTPNEQQEPRNG